MNRRSRIVFPILLLVCSAASAQSGRGADTARVDSMQAYTASEVVVRARSLLMRGAAGSQPTAIIPRERIESAAARDAADAVAYAPGVFVKQYGGLGGMRTISLRGTSAQQSVILIDGVRYQQSANGALDLSNIPADALQSVEVIRGGNAALFGANALGGAINLVTRAPERNGLTAELRTGAGSYGERELGVGIRGRAGAHAVDLRLATVAADGDYPFGFNEFGASTTKRRENADFSNWFGRAAWAWETEGARLSLSSQGYRSERGVPGAVVQGSREQLHARLEERDLFAVAQVALGEGDWSGSWSASGRLNVLRYVDPDSRLAGPEGIDNRYDRREASTVLRARHAVSANGVIGVAGELGWARLDGDNLDPAAGGVVDRVQGSAVLLADWSFDDEIPGIELAIDAAVRGDLFSDLDPAVSPSLGIVARPAGSDLRVRAHAALNHRVPSFQEQYYLNYGNIDLRPERSRSLDIGATYLVNEMLLLEAGVFLIDTRDQIVSVPRSPVSWSAANVGRVLARGVELAASGTLFDGLVVLQCSYTRMRVEDRSGGEADGKLLVYAPEEIVASLVDLRVDRYVAGISWQYASHRHTLPLNTPESALPHYVVIGARAAARFELGPVGAALRLEISNLFDAAYQVVASYPMPGRTLRVGLDLNYSEVGG